MTTSVWWFQFIAGNSLIGLPAYWPIMAQFQTVLRWLIHPKNWYIVVVCYDQTVWSPTRSNWEGRCAATFFSTTVAKPTLVAALEFRVAKPNRLSMDADLLKKLNAAGKFRQYLLFLRKKASIASPCAMWVHSLCWAHQYLGLLSLTRTRFILHLEHMCYFSS